MGKTNHQGYDYGRLQISNRDCVKDYLALVHGTFAESRGDCREPIDKSTYSVTRTVRVHESGDAAVTLWEALAEYESPTNGEVKYTLVHIRIVTGRTHQTRVHLSHMGHPIVSDWQYCKADESEQWKLEQEMFLINIVWI